MPDLGFLRLSEAAALAAAATGRAVTSVLEEMRRPNCPRIEPAHRLGASLLFAPADVDTWGPLYVQWVADGPHRQKAAKAGERAERERQAQSKNPREIPHISPPTGSFRA